ncbi:MAG: endonuclease/exonuclease/phosphatase family protein [Ilumatobacteraceae bacterium]
MPAVDPTFSLVTYNIQYSLGADGRYDLERSINAVSDADIICLQEVERNWRRTGMADQPAAIAERLPDRHWVYAPILDVDASSVAFDGTVTNRRRQFGQMLLSRWPILSSRVVHLPKIDTGDAANAWCGALETVIAVPGGAVRVVNVHLTDITETNRMTQVWALVRLLADAPVEGGAWNGIETDPEAHDHWQFDDPPPPMPVAAIVVGDFNDEPHSPVLDVMRRSGYRDAWSVDTARTPGWVTFKTNPEQGTYADMRIDFVLVNDGVEVDSAEIDVDCAASDHQPVRAWLRVRQN